MNQAEQISFFDHMCRVWDEISKPDEAKINFLLDRIGLKSGESVLDVGTGTGVLLPYISDRTQNAKIDAVDYSSGMLGEACRKFGHLPHISFLQKDIEAYDWPTRYDKIILYSVFPHLLCKEETITRLVNRHLREGGRLIIAHSNSRQFLNQMHKQKDSRVSEAALLPVTEQKEIFRCAGIAVIEAFEDNDYYYLVIENSPVLKLEESENRCILQPI